MKIKEYARNNYTLKESYERVRFAWTVADEAKNRTETLIMIADAMKKESSQMRRSGM